MKLSEYFKKHKKTVRGFARDNKISRYSIHKYMMGAQPAPRQAWKIFNATDGEVEFQDMNYYRAPKNPLKDV